MPTPPEQHDTLLLPATSLYEPRTLDVVPIAAIPSEESRIDEASMLNSPQLQTPVTTTQVGLPALDDSTQMTEAFIPTIDVGNLTTQTPSTHPHMTTQTTDDQFTMIISLVKQLSNKFDGLGRRMINMERQLVRLEGTCGSHFPCPPITETTARTSCDRVSYNDDEPPLDRETVSSIHSVSLGPGNFAKKLVERVFPELFGPSNLRMGYSVYGGGKKGKMPLEHNRLARVRTLINHYYPEMKVEAAWRDRIVPKINEGLRRKGPRRSDNDV